MKEHPLRVLFATSECVPWIKTGGLADVAASLPPALAAHGLDVRVVLPAYRSVLAAATHRREVMPLPAFAGFPAARLFEAPLPSGVPAWLVDCPTLYDRDGGPYQNPAGRDWPDSALRFGLLSYVAALLAYGQGPFSWSAQILHCNDWQTALGPAYARLAGGPATLMCVHNLAFQGLFPPETVAEVGLPPESFAVDGVEFFGKMSFLKAGLVYADALATVSPTYAREIQREPLGFGLQGVLAGRSERLHGILNGIDGRVWNPATDRLIARRYDASRLDAKRDNKRALQQRMGLPDTPDAPLFGFVGRLTEQKGVDLIAAIAPQMIAAPAQLVVLGTGEAKFEERFATLARTHPRAIGVRIGFDEALAHLIEAGSDAFLMPSRFEPCGLNQMYSQRYGTPPIARATGGLADSIFDCSPASLADETASGFLFAEPTPRDLWAAVERALELYRDLPAWRVLQRNGMAYDFSWEASARSYAELYATLA